MVTAGITSPPSCSQVRRWFRFTISVYTSVFLRIACAFSVLFPRCCSPAPKLFPGFALLRLKKGGTLDKAETVVGWCTRGMLLLFNRYSVSFVSDPLSRRSACVTNIKVQPFLCTIATALQFCLSSFFDPPPPSHAGGQQRQPPPPRPVADWLSAAALSH